MKKTILSIIGLILLMACSKEINNQAPEQLPTFSALIANYSLPADANAEVRRIAEAVQSPDYTFGITDNPNYGIFSSTPEYGVFMSGSTPNTIGLQLDGISIDQSNGQWLQQGLVFKQFYGKTVEVVITNNGIVQVIDSIYVPEPALTPVLGSNLHISRSGNVLSWEADQNNPANKISLVYSLYNSADIGDISGEIKRGVLVIDNNGSYSIDHLLSDLAVKKIYFRLVSGNALAAEIDGNKILFSIKTYDQHIYIVD